MADMATDIARLPDLLSWEDRCDDLAGPYRAALADGLGGLLGRLEAAGARSGVELVSAISRLPQDAFDRLLTAPETSYRLLHPRRHEPASVDAFLRRAAEAELVREHRAEACQTLWTALGDFRAEPGGGHYAAPTVRGIVLDFEGPYASDLNRGAKAAAAFGEGDRYDAETRSRLAQRLAGVLAGIDAVNPLPARFVAQYTRVILLVKDGQVDGSFVSRSPERRIGLTLLANAHAADLDDVELAESLVHEAIHSLVEAAETLANLAATDEEKWISDARLYDGTPRTVSPWTGTRLVAPTYVHACFVWYGVVCFWAQALRTDAFSAARVQDRLRAAMRGFLAGSMVDQLEPFRGAMHPALTVALVRMRDDVSSAFEAACTA